MRGQVFYDYYIYWLLDPFACDALEVASASEGAAAPGATAAPSASAVSGAVVALTDSMKASRGHAADLLSYCVAKHTYRMKFFVLRNNVIGRVLGLLRQSDKFLQLCALRFIRACVGVKDQFLNGHLTKKGHLAPVFALFKANGARDNLISSAVIDLVEFVRTENVKSLVEHMMSFRPSFEGIDYVTTFEQLSLMYDQNTVSSRDVDEGLGGGGVKGGGGGGKAAAEWRKARELDDEEAYFAPGDDDEMTGAAEQHSPDGGGSGLSAGAGGVGGTLMGARVVESALGYIQGSASGASSDGSTTALSSGSDASDSDDDIGPRPAAPEGSWSSAAAGAESPPSSPGNSFKPRSLSPVAQPDAKDGLSRMFDMGGRVGQRAGLGISVRRIEMVLPTSSGAIDVGTAAGGSGSGEAGMVADSDDLPVVGEGVEASAVEVEAPDPKRQKT